MPRYGVCNRPVKQQAGQENLKPNRPKIDMKMEDVLKALADTYPAKDIELVLRRDGSCQIIDKVEYPELASGCVTQRFDNLGELYEFLDLP